MDGFIGKSFCIIIFTAATLILNAASASIQIKDLRGEIRPSDVIACQPPFPTWEFPKQSLRFLLLNLVHLDISECNKAKLTLVKPLSVPKSYCGLIAQDRWFALPPVTLELSMIAGNCNNKVAVRYIYTNIELTVAPTDVIATNSKASFTVTILLPPDEMPFIYCEATFGDLPKQVVKGNQTFHQKFESSRKYDCEVECNSRPITGPMNSKINVAVEDHFTQDDLNVICDTCMGRYSEVNEFKHQFQHNSFKPVRYELIFRDFSLNNPLTMSVSNSPTRVYFTLSTLNQKKLRPGSHKFTLLLYNQISTVAFTQHLVLYQKLLDLRISSDKQIGMQPNHFTATVSLTEAPADVTIQLIHDGDNRTETIKKLYCKTTDECQTYHIKLAAPDTEGIYRLEATAKNYFGQIKAQPKVIQSLPQIYEVYATVSDAQVNKDFTIWIFVRGDRGQFELRVEPYTRPGFQHFYIKNFNHDHGLRRLPFDSKVYTPTSVNRKFNTAGLHNIKIRLVRGDETYDFDKTIHVRPRPSCLSAIYLRGHHAATTKKPLNVDSDFILSVNAISTCVEKSRISYQWSFHKMNSFSDIPKEENKINLKTTDLYQPEVMVKATGLEEGLYIGIVEVRGTEQSKTVYEEKQYAAFKNPEETLKVVIEGGSKREIGKNTKSIILERYIIGQKDISDINTSWFCSVTKDNLPDNQKIGKVTQKGSCFLPRPSFAGSDSLLNLNMESLKRSSKYFVRVIVQAPGHKQSFADQEIVFLERHLPDIKLRCWSNCGPSLLCGEPLILQLECTECDRITWHLERDSLEQLHECDDQEWCKLNANTIDSVNKIRNTAIVAKGKTQNDVEASVSLNINARAPPRVGKCSAISQNEYGEAIGPAEGYAYITKFTINCGLSDHEQTTLTYRFYLKHSGNMETLLQYGHDNNLRDILLVPEADTFIVSIAVDICDQFQSCNTYIANATVYNNLDEKVDESVMIEANLQTLNYQSLLQMVAPISSSSQLSQTMRFKIINSIYDVKPTFPLAAKLLSDILNHVTKQPSESMRSVEVEVGVLKQISTLTSPKFPPTLRFQLNTPDIKCTSVNTVGGLKIILMFPRKTYFTNALAKDDFKDEIWKALSNIKSFANKEFAKGSIRSRDIKTIIASYLTTMTHAMQIDGTIVANVHEMVEMGRYWIKVAMPGDKPDLLHTDSFKAATQRTVVDLLNVKLSNFSTNLPRDVINVEIFNYDWPDIQIANSNQIVDQVTTVSITTRSKNATSTFIEMEQKFPIQFTFKNRPILTDFSLKVTTEKERRIAVGESSIEKDSSLESSFGSYLEIIAQSDEIEATTINVTLSDEENYTSHHLSIWLPNERFVWSIPPNELLQGTDRYKVNIKLDLGSRFYRQGKIIKIKFAAFFASCFDWNYENSDWSRDACKPFISKNFSQPESCQCFSNTNARSVRAIWSYPSIYGSRMINLTNTIDENKVSRDILVEIMENPIIAIVLLTFYLLFIPLWVWAYTKDKMDAKKGFFTEVCDNSPHHKYRYYITIFTGHRSDAGTTAAVSMTLIGKKHHSHVHVIQNAGEELLSRGSVSSFLITTKNTLGDITNVRLWRNNAGANPNWYLDRIVVRDLETKECWFFRCKTWFTYVPDMTFEGAKSSELHQFSFQLWNKLVNYFPDKYLWLSVYAMKPTVHRSMTRVRRLASSYALLFLIMLTNLTIYGAVTQRPGFELPIGSFSLDWSQFGIGWVSATLSLGQAEVIAGLFSLYPMDQKYRDAPETPKADTQRQRKQKRKQQDKKKKKRTSSKKRQTPKTNSKTRRQNPNRSQPRAPAKKKKRTKMQKTEGTRIGGLNKLYKYRAGSKSVKPKTGNRAELETTPGISHQPPHWTDSPIKLTIDPDTSRSFIPAEDAAIWQQRMAQDFLRDVEKLRARRRQKKLEEELENIEMQRIIEKRPDKNKRLHKQAKKYKVKDEAESRPDQAGPSKVTHGDRNQQHKSKSSNEKKKPETTQRKEAKKSKEEKRTRPPSNRAPRKASNKITEERPPSPSKKGPLVKETAPKRKKRQHPTPSSGFQSMKMSTPSLHSQGSSSSREESTWNTGNNVSLSSNEENCSFASTKYSSTASSSDSWITFEEMTSSSDEKWRGLAAEDEENIAASSLVSKSEKILVPGELVQSQGQAVGLEQVDSSRQRSIASSLLQPVNRVAPRPRCGPTDTPGMAEVQPDNGPPLPTQLVLYFAWFCVFSSVAVSSFICLRYGVDYGTDIAKEWLLSLAFSILILVFIVEPMKIWLMAMMHIYHRKQFDVRDWVFPIPKPVFPRKHRHPRLAHRRFMRRRKKNILYKPPVYTFE